MHPGVSDAIGIVKYNLSYSYFGGKSYAESFINGLYCCNMAYFGQCNFYCIR